MTTMEDAIKAGDGTLHGAIDYWQEQCATLRAELSDARAALREIADAVSTISTGDLSTALTCKGIVDKARATLGGTPWDTQSDKQCTKMNHSAMGL